MPDGPDARNVSVAQTVMTRSATRAPFVLLVSYREETRLITLAERTVPSAGTAAQTSPILSVRDLSVEFVTGGSVIRAVDGVSWTAHAGEIMALVGESGCGKSATAAALTRAEHPTGSDRLAEVADQLGWSDDQIVVNLQGDEPQMPLSCLHAVVAALQEDVRAAAATLATPATEVRELFDPSCVKVVSDTRGRALYFSRAPIPWARDAMAADPASLPPVPSNTGGVGC